jgi:hypothetical protein
LGLVAIVIISATANAYKIILEGFSDLTTQSL